MGEDLFSNLDDIERAANDSSMGAEQSELAVIVGAARAVQDLGGSNVHVCLRPGGSGEVEFQIQSDGQNEFDQWMTVAEFGAAARSRNR